MVFFRREGEIGRGMKGRHVPVDTTAGRIGTLFDEEGWLPEPGRCLAKQLSERAPKQGFLPPPRDVW